MLKIKLRRVGGKGQPSYRIVVAESTSPRDGKFVELIGFYNPRTQPETIQVKEERVLHWLKVGAKPTDSTARLLSKVGTMERFNRMKAGEPVEALVAEAEEAAKTRVVSPKTEVGPVARTKAAPAE